MVTAADKLLGCQQQQLLLFQSRSQIADSNRRAVKRKKKK